MLRGLHATLHGGGTGRHAGETYQRSIHGLSLVTDREEHPTGLIGCGTASGGRQSGLASRAATFIEPPEELEDGYFERPTPLLLVAGEAQSPAWWSRASSFFSARGCTVGTMALSGRGSSPEDMLTLKALQTGVATAVENSGLTPPVLVAHSMAGFVCQQYLQSYPAAGLVLLDSFPPEPSEERGRVAHSCLVLKCVLGLLAKEHLALIWSSEIVESAGLHPVVDVVGMEELAKMVKETPSQWEACLRRHFDDFHENSPWQKPSPQVGDAGDGAPTKKSTRSSLDAETLGTKRPRFPAKAFAQMCLDLPSSTLRLERHAVDTLVLGSRGHPVGSANSADFRALEAARLEGLEAICEFHGTDGWRLVDAKGRVGELDGPAMNNSWLEVVWDWYNARF